MGITKVTGCLVFCLISGSSLLSENAFAQFMDAPPTQQSEPSPPPDAQEQAPAPSRTPTAPKPEEVRPPGSSGAGNNSENSSAPGRDNTRKTPSSGNNTPRRPTSSESGKDLATNMRNHDKQAPVKLSAAKQSFSREKGLTSFLGKVNLLQDRVNIEADRADIFSQPGEYPNSENADKVVLRGNVKMQKKADRRMPSLYAEAQEVEYYPKASRAILKGKPKIWKGGQQTMVSGEVIQVNLETGDIETLNFGGSFEPDSLENRP